jgi:multisubunit Na+/H+ antiporter MnhG subunit
MVRTPRQRRWADASIADRLEYLGLLLAVVLVATDILFGGLFPIWVVVLAALYVFIVGFAHAIAIAGASFR